MRTRNHRPLTYIRVLVLISTFIIAVAALAVPFYSVRSESLPGAGKSEVSVAPKVSSNIRSLSSLAWTPMVSLPVAGETIAIYAADCSTPKTEFNLGDVICAVTDGVDLVTEPGNYYVNWHSPSNVITDGPTITQNPQSFLFSLPTSPSGNLGTWTANIGRVSPAESSVIGSPPNFTVGSAPSISIFASDCATPKLLFNLQDADKTVCAKATGFDPNQFILWSNAENELVQSAPVGTGTATFALTAMSSLGDWRVILYEPFGGDVYAVTPFTVIDAANPTADVTVSKAAASETLPAGEQAVFTVQVTNLGPSDAIAVTITDSIPANTSFSSFALQTGPNDTNCVLPTVGATSGDTVCTIPTLARGQTAVFLAAYDVVSGTLPGTVITNTVSIGSTTPDPNEDNDSSSSSVRIEGEAAGTCSLNCPANVVVTADTTEGGEFGAFVTFSAAGVTGDCGSVTNTPGSGSFFNVGTHSIVSQSEFGGATCTFTVTVLDTDPPTISCPPNITATAGAGDTTYTLPSGPGTPTINASGGGTVTGVRSDDTPATFDENGNQVTPAVVHAVTDPYPIGSTGINWTVTDAGGRTASCTQIITIVAADDRDPVTITCPANVSVTAPEGSCDATISLSTIGTPTTNPSDSNVGVVATRNDGQSLSDPFPGGTTIITWTATDNTNGNVASCTQTVTVAVNSGDTTPPVLDVPPNVSVTTGSCTATLDEELGTATATDSGSCNGDGSVSVSRSGVPANFVFPTGTTIITYTATDASGNTATGIQQVTVTESPAIPPTIDAPAPVSVNTGPDATSCGTVVSDAILGTATASDNCPGVTVTRTGVPEGNFFPVGNTTVTYTATDKSGNIATDTQVVTVTDNTVPVVTPPGAVTLYTGPDATLCGVLVSDLDGTLGTGSATDNCPGVGTVSRSGVPAGNVFPVGQTTLTYSATDAHGNTGQATQLVTVVDNTAPVISCPADIVIEPTCPTGAIATYSAPTATDNCEVQSVNRTAGGASGSVFSIGTTTVTHTATDIYNNQSSCNFTVTVLTPQAVIENLIASVTASSLTGPQKNGLISKLNAALSGLNNGQTNIACPKLSDFINSVGNLISHGNISAAQGNAWISSANNVRNTIGCTNNPCS